MKDIVKYLLRALFLVVYLLMIRFFVWQYVPIDSSMGVIGGSLLAIVLSLVLALVTVNKLVDVLQK